MNISLHFSGFTLVCTMGAADSAELPAHGSEQEEHDGFRPVHNSNTENLYQFAAVVRGD